MRKFHYRTGRNAFAAIGLGILALACGLAWLGDGEWPLALGFVLFGAAGVKAAANAMSDEPALVFDAYCLKVRTSFGVREALWSDVQAISLEVFTYRYWGIIPIARHENLVIKTGGGTFGSRRLRIAVKSIELPPGGSTELVHLLHQQHVAAVGQAGVAMAGADQHGWGVRPGRAARVAVDTDESLTGFDPDAALARYLAAREQQPEVAAAERAIGQTPQIVPQPARAAFGRKGL
ncbi:hypothetical protein OMW55_11335 [Sphingomonas sp. BN140010]|uniref:DUF304 domain-containing protein n=1 Tax=Sphingomonas arvum TaxID=2992113 RepID=A0ABT3JH34_9SPHN|nr:hypothetical protein [Sphingomonas sp. BN140010]MCW3798397.1 hypothetical protein [Sphingomonas sp. BN140010]